MSDTTETADSVDEAGRPPLSYLLEVQDLDTKINQLRYKIEHLPERAELAELAPQADEAEGRLKAAADAKATLESEERKLEALDEDLEAKLVEADRTLYGGTLKAMRSIEALQHEITMMKEQQSDAETRILEIFDEIEALDAAATVAEADKVNITAATAEAEARLEKAVGEINVELTGLEAQRAEAAEHVPEDMLKHYVEYRDYYDGQVVARFEGGNCRGCPIAMPATEADRVKHLPVNTEVTCDECGRWVLR